MIKILAISGIVISAITISIFMMQGPCDPYKPPPPMPVRKEQMTATPQWMKDFYCRIQNLPESSPKPSLSPASSPSSSPSADLSNSKPSSSLSAIFKFNSRDESRATGLKLESFVYKDHPVKKFNPFLPIKIVLESSGNILWKSVIGVEDCHDDEKIPYCKATSFKNNPAWWKGSFTLTAYDKDDQKITELIYGS